MKENTGRMKERLHAIKSLSHLTRRGCGKQLVVCVLITSWRFIMFVSNVPCLHLSIFVTTTCKVFHISWILIWTHPVRKKELQPWYNKTFKCSLQIFQQRMKKTIILPHSILNVCFTFLKQNSWNILAKTWIPWMRLFCVRRYKWMHHDSFSSLFEV